MDRLEKLRPLGGWSIYILALFLALAFATYDPTQLSSDGRPAGIWQGPRARCWLASWSRVSG